MSESFRSCFEQGGDRIWKSDRKRTTMATNATQSSTTTFRDHYLAQMAEAFADDLDAIRQVVFFFFFSPLLLLHSPLTT